MKNLKNWCLVMFWMLLTVVITCNAYAFTERTEAYSEADYNSHYQAIYNAGYYTVNDYGTKGANCTYYAYRRAWEILGYQPTKLNNLGNARYWYDHANVQNNFKRGTEPKLGAIACWGGSGAGHVAIVERIVGNQLRLSEGQWSGNKAFNIFFRYTDNMYYGSYTFLGYIYLTEGGGSDPDPDKHTPPTRVLNYTGGTAQSGDDVVWVQCVLKKLGYSVDIDGSYGPAMKTTITQFQKDNGLEQDGSCGPATLAKLKERWAATKGTTGSEMKTGYDRALPDGDYVIASAANPTYYLDIQGGDFPAKHLTNVTLWQATDDVGPQDVWTVTYNASDKFYTIKQKGANISLDVSNASVSSGANIQAANANSTSAQKWAISYNGTQGYRVQAKCSGLSMDITGAKVTSGTNIQQHISNDSIAQAWVFIPYRPAQPIENGRYVLVSGMKDNVVLDVVGDTKATTSPTNVQIWDDSVDSRFNSFDVTKLDNGYYKLVNTASGMALEVTGGGSTYRNNVAVGTSNSGKTQQWAITKAGSGYTLRVRSSGYCLNVQGYDNYQNGTNVFQWPVNGPQNNQIWKFVPAEHTITFHKNWWEDNARKVITSYTKYYKSPFSIGEIGADRTGYKFLGWSTSKNSTTAEYQTGSKITADQDMTLYAIYEATEHVHAWSDWTQKTPATCTEAEVLSCKCSECGTEETKTGAAATGHLHTETINVKNATCSEMGYTGDVYCLDCNTVIKTGEVLPLTDHQWGEGVVTTEPTCTEEGIRTYTCLNDPTHTRTEAVDALGHDFGEWKVAREATQTQDGLEIRYCSRDEKHVETRAIKYDHVHTPVKTEEGKAPTCTEDGYEAEVRCADCGMVLEDRHTLKATGHNWGEWVVITPATKSAEGMEVRVCANDSTHIETRAIDKLSGQDEPSTEDEPKPQDDKKPTSEAPAEDSSKSSMPAGTFKLGTASFQIQNGEATITKPSNKNVKTFSIPSTVVAQGHIIPVTAIAPYAFKGMKNLTAIEIGANIQKIGKGAFQNCKKLRKVTIRTVKLTSKTVGAKAFKGIHTKATIKVPGSKKKEYSKFLYKKGLKKTARFK